jgi:hypothetical protein
LLGGYFVFGERNAINEQVRTFIVIVTTTPTPTAFALAYNIPFAAMLMLLCVYTWRLLLLFSSS